MNSWAAGYVSDIDYTYGYYPELNPLRARLAFLNQGLVFPTVGSACELGFGQGLSTNFHAAASVTQWFGTDFNPAQAGFAQDLASASGSGARLYDESFSDFFDRTDLPDFDYIGLHGIWSWVSYENRQLIIEFIRKKLKVGGVLYVSYNAQPGWAGFAPMRQLLTEHAKIVGSKGEGVASRINGAIDFAEQFLATSPSFLRANPYVVDRFNEIKGHNRRYLAHEYFNCDWLPMYFTDMAEFLGQSKMQYACSAQYFDHIDAINLGAEQQVFLETLSDSTFRETTRDFIVNRQFRRDYWVKGIRQLNAIEQVEAWKMQRVMLTTHRVDVPCKVSGVLGEITLSQEIYAPILDFLADHKPKSVGQIEQGIKNAEVTFPQIIQAIILLVGAGHLAPVQEDVVTSKVKKHTDKLNAYLCQKARGSHDVQYLVSPVTGGGFNVGRFQQLFLLCIIQGKKTPAEWVQSIWETLASQGQRLVKDGKALGTVEDNLGELSALARIFIEKQLPILKALQIA